jgi:hypothetical protein
LAVSPTYMSFSDVDARNNHGRESPFAVWGKPDQAYPVRFSRASGIETPSNALFDAQPAPGQYRFPG